MQYAPGISYHGDAYIAQGMHSVGDRLTSLLAGYVGDAINRSRQKKELVSQLDSSGYGQDDASQTGAAEDGALDAAGNPTGQEPVSDQLAQRGKQAKALRNLVKTYNPNASDALEGMSVDQLEGLVKGQAVKSAMQEHAANLKRTLAQVAEYKAQTQNALAQEALRTRAEQAESEVGPWFKTFANYMGTKDQDGKPVTPDTAIAAASEQYPNAMGSQKFANLMSSYAQLGSKLTAGGAPKIMVDKDSVPNYSLVTLEGSKQLQALPSAGAADVQMVDIGNGQQVPVVMGPRGNAQQLRPPTEIKVPESFHTAMDKIGQELADQKNVLQKDPSEFLDAKEAAKKQNAARRNLKLLQEQGKAVVDRYHSTGVLDDATRDATYAELGMAPVAAAGNGKKARNGKNETLTEERRAGLIAEANKAIAAGKDPKAVKARLKELGVDIQ